MITSRKLIKEQETCLTMNFFNRYEWYWISTVGKLPIFQLHLRCTATTMHPWVSTKSNELSKTISRIHHTSIPKHWLTFRLVWILLWTKHWRNGKDQDPSQPWTARMPSSYTGVPCAHLRPVPTTIAKMGFKTDISPTATSRIWRDKTWHPLAKNLVRARTGNFLQEWGLSLYQVTPISKERKVQNKIKHSRRNTSQCDQIKARINSKVSRWGKITIKSSLDMEIMVSTYSLSKTV